MMNDVGQVHPFERDRQLPSGPSGVQPGKSGGLRGAPDPPRRSQTGRMKVRWEWGSSGPNFAQMFHSINSAAGTGN